MSDQLPADLEYRFSLAESPDPDYGRFLISFKGNICWWDPEQGEERSLAVISGQRLALAEALDEGLDQGPLLDSISAELSEFSETVLRDSRCLLPGVERPSLDAVECECLIYVAELRVDSKWRSHGLGTALLRHLGTMLDVNNCLIALKAFPLTDKFGAPVSQTDIQRVKGYYAKHDFVPAGGEFMVKDARLCESMKKRLKRHQARR